jgi:hypothetical protein
MIFGYARVSTDAQDLTAQLKDLKAAGCERVFKEKVTGATADRPQLKKLLREVDHGDVVIIAAVDRLSRDTTDLLVIAPRPAKGWRWLAFACRACCRYDFGFCGTSSRHAWRRREARTPTHQGAHRARTCRCKSQWREIRTQAQTHAAPEARSDQAARQRGAKPCGRLAAATMSAPRRLGGLRHDRRVYSTSTLE